MLSGMGEILPHIYIAGLNPGSVMRKALHNGFGIRSAAKSFDPVLSLVECTEDRKLFYGKRAPRPLAALTPPAGGSAPALRFFQEMLTKALSEDSRFAREEAVSSC